MKKILYVSPVCHLVEVAAQMSVICNSGDILNPSDETNPNPSGPVVAPKRI